MRAIDADALMQSLGITDPDCPKCKWYNKSSRRCSRGGDFEDACCAIDDAPTIEAEPQWIPCKERLPEKEIDVLCCRDNKTMAIMHFNPVLTTRYPKGFSVVENAFSWRQDNVIAWMPLPEPYREDNS